MRRERAGPRRVHADDCFSSERSPSLRRADSHRHRHNLRTLLLFREKPFVEARIRSPRPRRSPRQLLLFREKPFVEAPAQRPRARRSAHHCFSSERSPSLRRLQHRGRHRADERLLLFREKPFVEAPVIPDVDVVVQNCFSSERSPSLRLRHLAR